MLIRTTRKTWIIRIKIYDVRVHVHNRSFRLRQVLQKRCHLFFLKWKVKFTEWHLRVPTPNVSLVDLVVDLKQDVTVEMVNDAFKQSFKGAMAGILRFTTEPLVSIDFNTTTDSAIIDGLSTIVMGDRKVKVLAWYDNEWGYSARVVDLAKKVGKALKTTVHA